MNDMVVSEAPVLDNEKLVKIYVKMRDKRSALKKAWEAEDKAIAAQQEQLSEYMLAQLNATNTDAVRTSAGTFYREEVIIPQGADWDAFYAWVAKNNAFDALERRIKRTFVSAYMEEHDGEVPPGVSVFRKYDVKVRRSD